MGLGRFSLPLATISFGWWEAAESSEDRIPVTLCGLITASEAGNVPNNGF